MGTWQEAVKAARQELSTTDAEVAAAKAKVRAAMDEQEALAQRRASAEKTIHEARSKALAAALTPDLIDALAPEHTRRGCTDDNIANDFSGCERCALLSAMACGAMLTSWAFTVERFP